ncbi:hypothetical protein, partial [Escherichia coli]|uniref:hypothetical protein n=1 Tax=Escherichia coli TaxID=562 RepID=UPI0025404CC7
GDWTSGGRRGRVSSTKKIATTRADLETFSIVVAHYNDPGSDRFGSSRLRIDGFFTFSIFRFH